MLVVVLSYLQRFQAKLLVAIVLIGLGTLVAGKSEAATVYSCSETTKRCVIRLEEGIVGDRVQVLDEKAQRVARGFILRRKGSYAIISLSEVSKTIRKGYPVIVNLENRNSNLQWAASFSDKDY